LTGTSGQIGYHVFVHCHNDSSLRLFIVSASDKAGSTTSE
jgi:hypothetical protein